LYLLICVVIDFIPQFTIGFAGLTFVSDPETAAPVRGKHPAGEIRPLADVETVAVPRWNSSGEHCRVVARAERRRAFPDRYVLDATRGVIGLGGTARPTNRKDVIVIDGSTR